MLPSRRFCVLLGFLSTLAPAQPIPSKMSECEGNTCGTWTFNGHDGKARWQNGAIANLTVQRFDSAVVVIKRIDVGGSTPGLTAMYTGTLHGNRIEGNVTWTWPGHFKTPPTGKWSATIGEDLSAHTPAGPPASRVLSTPQSREPLLPSMSEPTIAMKSRRMDLNGDWEGYFNTPAFPQTIRVKQSGGTISAEALTSNLSPTGQPFFRGTYDPPAIAGQVELADIGAPPSSWTPATLTVGDPDHFRIGNRPPFQRIMPALGDVPCDKNNSFHVQAGFALQRGKLAHNAKNYDSSVCWFYVGAIQGNSEAQGLLGAHFRDGFHIEKNPTLAFYWMQKSADQGNPSGALTLADMYEHGEGTPADAAKAQFWRTRSNQLQAQVNKEALAEQRAEALQNRQLEALTGLAIAGAVILADPGLPGPCEILSQYASSGALSAAEASKVDQARRQIAAGNIKCPPHF
jgi:hypothetical protein